MGVGVAGSNNEKEFVLPLPTFDTFNIFRPAVPLPILVSKKHPNAGLRLCFFPTRARIGFWFLRPEVAACRSRELPMSDWLSRHPPPMDRPCFHTPKKHLRIRIPSTPLHLSKTCLNDKILASDNNTEPAPDRTRVVSRNLFGQKPDSHLSSLHDCSSSGLKRLNPKEMFWSKSCSIIM